MYQVYIISSEALGRKRFDVMEPTHSLDEAMDFVYMIDSQYTVWETMGFPKANKVPYPAYLVNYEDCDVFAEGPNGLIYAFNNDGDWELLPCSN